MTSCRPANARTSGRTYAWAHGMTLSSGFSHTARRAAPCVGYSGRTRSPAGRLPGPWLDREADLGASPKLQIGLGRDAHRPAALTSRSDGVREDGGVVVDLKGTIKRFEVPGAQNPTNRVKGQAMASCAPCGQTFEPQTWKIGRDGHSYDDDRGCPATTCLGRAWPVLASRR